jgi:hypothetical protein
MSDKPPREFRIGHLSAMIKQRTTECIILCGYDPNEFHMDALLSSVQIRNGIIRDEYDRRRKAGERKTEIIEAICAEYGLAFDYVENITKDKI